MAARNALFQTFLGTLLFSGALAIECYVGPYDTNVNNEPCAEGVTYCKVAYGNGQRDYSCGEPDPPVQAAGCTDVVEGSKSCYCDTDLCNVKTTFPMPPFSCSQGNFGVLNAVSECPQGIYYCTKYVAEEANVAAAIEAGIAQSACGTSVNLADVAPTEVCTSTTVSGVSLQTCDCSSASSCNEVVSTVPQEESNNNNEEQNNNNNNEEQSNNNTEDENTNGDQTDTDDDDELEGGATGLKMSMGLMLLAFGRFVFQ